MIELMYGLALMDSRRISVGFLSLFLCGYFVTGVFPVRSH